MKIIPAQSIYMDADNIHPYAFMEKAGRTCYKSLDKITDDSAIKFVQGLKKSGHTAMLEHSHIILKTSKKTAERLENEISVNDHWPYLNEKHKIDFSPIRIGSYLNISVIKDSAIISGSFRAFLGLYQNKNDLCNHCTLQVLTELKYAYPELFDETPNLVDRPLKDDVKVLSRKEFVDFVNEIEPSDKEFANKIIMKHLTHTVLFICDRGVSHEFVRHRPASFAQESTRYCNYSKDKFGNEITVIDPCFWPDHDSIKYKLWKEACEFAEKAYFKLMAEEGTKAQEARDILPTSVKTELIMTATEEEWQHIINLRYHGTTGAPHPQMIESIKLIYPTLCEKSENRLK